MFKIKLYTAGSGSISAEALLLSDRVNYTFHGSQYSDDEVFHLKRSLDAKQTGRSFSQASSKFVFEIDTQKGRHTSLENARKCGHALYAELKNIKASEVLLKADGHADYLYAFAEGLALSAYHFSKYKKEKPDYQIENIWLDSQEISAAEVEKLNALTESVFFARDLVNEPVNFLTAMQLSTEILQAGKQVGYRTEVLEKQKIETLRMGGLLAVNAGSVDPPTFNILEWTPDNAINSKPIILVGKGVVYDTGGLSLKPTPNSMDSMKSDMAGAAAVAGIIRYLAQTKAPLKVIGLIPATDNRPSGNAITPGDVITMYDGTTIEVLNTDAEGRLILGDALHYARQYDPELVMDFATLTGAAVRAIGISATAYMGTASADIRREVSEAGHEVHERLVEFPLWDDYADQLKSDIADMKNVAVGGNAGMITAGKFLEHFTTGYPWLHFDIAGPSFLPAADSYRGKNGTGVAVRLIVRFLEKYMTDHSNPTPKA